MNSGSEFIDTSIKILESQNRESLATNVARDDLVEFRFRADETAGEFPQAKEAGERSCFIRDGGLYYDRVPIVVEQPIRFLLKPQARWSDIMSSSPFGHALLLNDRAKDVFSQFNADCSAEFTSEVQSHTGEIRSYTYAFLTNHLSSLNFDFSNSIFSITDAMGRPQTFVQIDSEDAYWRLATLAQDGTVPGCEVFSNVSLSKLKLRKNSTDGISIFGLGRFSRQMYMQRGLSEALKNASITGLEFKENSNLA